MGMQRCSAVRHLSVRPHPVTSARKQQRWRGHDDAAGRLGLALAVPGAASAQEGGQRDRRLW